MENKILLSTQIVNLKQFLLKQGFTTSCIHYYSSCWDKLTAYAIENKTLSYDEKLGLAFLKKVCHVKDPSTPSGNEHKSVRAIRLLSDYLYNGCVARKINNDPCVPEHFSKEFDAYLNHLRSESQSPGSISSKRSRVKILLEYLDSSGLKNLQTITKTRILDFMEFLRKQYPSISRSNILYTAKDYLLFCENHNLIKQRVSSIIKCIYTNPNETLPSVYTKAEVKKMLDVVNRKTPKGRKEYAMLILASVMGMRSLDIVRLECKSLKWENHCIEFFQNKTGFFTKLPMPLSVENVLTEYISADRPDVNCPYVFIRERSPIGPYSGSEILSHIVSKYMIKAGLDTSNRNHGPHALRHSMASWMLSDEQPLPVIATALGHGTTKNTSRYVRIDMERLRSVGLEIPS